jgi:transcriptional/translational regulatory protein YebC/TACO1
MSGHSKWATTKRAKAVTDSRRAQVFTKISKNIAVAARSGADPAMNAKLRLAIDQAKAVRMPKDNIERAIARGAGASGDAALESITYEGFGSGGVGGWNCLLRVRRHDRSQARRRADGTA